MAFLLNMFSLKKICTLRLVFCDYLYFIVLWYCSVIGADVVSTVNVNVTLDTTSLPHSVTLKQELKDTVSAENSNSGKSSLRVNLHFYLLCLSVTSLHVS